MPDGRLRDGRGYSTHPPTVKSRARIAALPAKEQDALKARSAECSSIWAACSRVSKSEKYKKANVNHRRQILLHHISTLFEKRGKRGTARFGVNEEVIVEKHLKKEAADRKLFQSKNMEEYSVNLKGISVDQRDERMSQDLDGENDVEGFDDSPLPVNMSLGNASTQGYDSEMLRIIRRLEHKMRSVEQKLESLFYQVITNNQLMMHQKGATLPNMPPPCPIPRSGFMSDPLVPLGNTTQHPERNYTGSSSYRDKVCASSVTHNVNPAGERMRQLEGQTVPQSGLHPMGFDLLGQDPLDREKYQQEPAGTDYYLNNFAANGFAMRHKSTDGSSGQGSF